VDTFIHRLWMTGRAPSLCPPAADPRLAFTLWMNTENL
jgi:hypothetical protein